MTDHLLKILPEHFQAVSTWKKTVELRRDDRGFQVGDTLHLMEWHPETGHTGRECRRTVTHIDRGMEYLAPGIVGLSLGPCAAVGEGVLADMAQLAASVERAAWATDSPRLGHVNRMSFLVLSMAQAEAERREVRALHEISPSQGTADALQRLARVRRQWRGALLRQLQASAEAFHHLPQDWANTPGVVA